jgi:hypothetical protein
MKFAQKTLYTAVAITVALQKKDKQYFFVVRVTSGIEPVFEIRLVVTLTTLTTLTTLPDR